MNRLLLWIGCLMIVVAATGCAKEDKGGFVYEDDAVEEKAVQLTSDMAEGAAEAMSDGSVPAAQVVAKDGIFGTFPIYTDDTSPDNHYFPSGWMGDYSDVNFVSDYFENPHSGTTSIKVEYNNKASQGARWAGIYWQNPANNWGNRPGGFDLTGATKLTFWARGEKGGERIEEFKIGGMTGEYSDTDLAGIGPVILTDSWKQYVIDLEDRDLTSITGGFAWAANIDANPDGITFYLDDIRYE